MTSFCTYTVFGNSVKLCVIENSLGQEVMSDKTNRMIEKRHFYSSKASFLTQRWIMWVFWLCLVLIGRVDAILCLSKHLHLNKPTILLYLNWSLQRPLGFNGTNQVYVSVTALRVVCTVWASLSETLHEFFPHAATGWFFWADLL